MTAYEVPKVWQSKENNQRSGNRPTSGKRFDYQLPVGKAPLQVYSLPTPNGIKIAIMLEELKELGVEGASYDLYQINIGEGDQFGSDFVSINPNSKIPALVDYSQDPAIKLFESGAILLYLADKHSVLISNDLPQRTETIKWLFWQTGAGPFVGGGFGHFYHYAPEKIEYAIDRFTMETKRQLHLLNNLLKDQSYISGEEYSIADIMIWPWYGRLLEDEVYSGAAEFLNSQEYPHLLTWSEKIRQRPGVQRGINLDYPALN